MSGKRLRAADPRRARRAWEPGTVDVWRLVDDVGPALAVERVRTGRESERVMVVPRDPDPGEVR